MKVCHKCGHENDDSVVYCEKCGLFLSTNSQWGKEPILFNPSNKIWLNIVLKGLMIIEVLFAISIFVVLVQGDPERFFYGLIGLAVFHLLAMLTLNLAFNVQSIKDDMKEVKAYLSKQYDDSFE